jgi:hypothetical protein
MVILPPVNALYLQRNDPSRGMELLDLTATSIGVWTSEAEAAGTVTA